MVRDLNLEQNSPDFSDHHQSPPVGTTDLKGHRLIDDMNHTEAMHRTMYSKPVHSTPDSARSGDNGYHSDGPESRVETSRENSWDNQKVLNDSELRGEDSEVSYYNRSQSYSSEEGHQTSTDPRSPGQDTATVKTERMSESPTDYSKNTESYDSKTWQSGENQFAHPLPSLANLARSPASSVFHSSLVSTATSNPGMMSPISGHMGFIGTPNRTPNGDNMHHQQRGGLRGDVYYCHLCTFIGMTKDEFDDHMGTHFEHQCPHCDYTSRTEGRLKRHIKDFHLEEQEARRDTSKTKVLRCRQCEFYSEDKHEFWNHQRAHIKDDKMLQCPKCPFVTEYKHHLEYHLRNHFGSKPYKCEKCNYACVNKSMLNSHMKSHTNVYQYRCADCTYATKYCHSLKLHLKKYNHKPATVLNLDGSLPTDGSGDFELVSKRGPPRGPRGPRKDKSPPPGFVPSMPPVSSAHMPLGPSLLGAPPMWPLIPGQPPLPGFPMPGLGYQGPPPLIPVSGVTHMNLSLDSQMNPFLAGLQPKLDIPGQFKCHLCKFSSNEQPQLMVHLLKVHPMEHQSLLRMYGLPPPEALLDANRQHQDLPSPITDRGNSMEMTKMWAMMAAAATHRMKTSPPMPAPEELTTRHPEKEQFKMSVARDLAATIQAEVDDNGDSPLDLTKHDSTPSSDNCGSNKRKYEEDWDDESPANREDQSASPRKRSRKGKAYKLDTLRLNKQEERISEAEGYESEGEYSSDWAGSDGPAAESTHISSQEISAAQDHHQKSHNHSPDHPTSIDESQHTPTESDNVINEYEQLQQNLAVLNGDLLPGSESNKSDAEPSQKKETMGNKDQKKSSLVSLEAALILSNSANHRKLLQVSRRLEPDFNRELDTKSDEMSSPEGTDVSSNFECPHCGIAFRDCIMYTVHMGYHGYRDPFKCNMCGIEAGNKVEFFLHIARAAHE